ncbi:MAG: AIR synthase related protein [Acidilobaceae archaeon]|nr:AIR synthase related protein [Acidilobaceae archaeon]
MSFERWLELLRRLAELSGSLHALEADASPFADLLLNIDGYSAEDSRLPWMSWSDWGWKATVAALADIAAAGGRGAAVAYSVGAPSAEVLEEVARGVGEAAAWAGVRVLKSDANRSREGWIDVVALGYTTRPLGRSGARPGELLIQVGLLGYGLVATLAMEGRLEIAEFPESLEYSRRPKPPLELGHRLAECGATAAIDNSDGWAASLYQLSLASGVRVRLESYLAAREALEALGAVGGAEEEVLHSWEDYNLAAAGGREAAECVLTYCRKKGIPCEVVGELKEGRGVEFRGKELPPRGWSPPFS